MFTDSLTETRDGKTFRLALLNVRRDLDLKPVGHQPAQNAHPGCCVSCQDHLLFTEKVLNKGKDKIKQRAQFYNEDLYWDLAVELVKTGGNMEHAYLHATYAIPLLVNHLRPREYRWAWLAEDRSRLFPVPPKDLLRIYREMKAAGAVNLWSGEPVVQPEGLRNRRARATTVDWGRPTADIIAELRNAVDES